MSELERERNELQSATQHLLHSQKLGEHAGFPQNRYRWRVAMARIREAEDDLNSALALLDEAELLYMTGLTRWVSTRVGKLATAQVAAPRRG